MTVQVDERAYTRSNVPCVICDARLRWTNVDDPQWNVGEDGIVCHDCFSIVASTCERCGEFGFTNLNTTHATYWAFYNSMHSRMRDAYGDNWHIFEPLAVRVARFARDMRGTLFPIQPNEMLFGTCDAGARCEACVYSCVECGEYYANVDENEMCDSCGSPQCAECGERWETERQSQNCCNRLLHSYDYTPTFRYWSMNGSVPMWNVGERIGWSIHPPTNELFMGIELETENGLDSFPQFMLDAGEVCNEENFVYAKSDGSLDDTGVELVTMPATLDAINAMFPWRALATWNANGARSFHRGTCGFHVHVSRRFFAPTHLWRFVAWQMRNQRFCEAIGQRTNSHWAQWQTLRDFGKDDAPTLEDVVKGKDANGSRYVAINFQNEHTIELRYFRGNLREDAIRLRIEFVDALAHYTKTIGAGDVLRGALGAGAFVHYCMENAERYATLTRWILDNETYGEDA